MTPMDRWLRGKPFDSDPLVERIEALNGTMTQAQAAKVLGMKQTTLSRRCRVAGIRWKKHSPNRPDLRKCVVAYQGELMSMFRLAEATGLDRKMLWRRYQRGLRGADLVAPSRVGRSYDISLTEREIQAFMEDYRTGKASRAKRPTSSLAHRWRLPRGAVAAIIRGEWHRLRWVGEDAA